jgi:hypothetical protein
MSQKEKILKPRKNFPVCKYAHGIIGRPSRGEALLGLLGPPGASPTTPENRFLKRNHGAFPVLEEPSEFIVEFSGVGLTPPTSIISLDQIKAGRCEIDVPGLTHLVDKIGIWLPV